MLLAGWNSARKLGPENNNQNHPNRSTKGEVRGGARVGRQQPEWAREERMELLIPSLLRVATSAHLEC